jgi:hypothetical protein
MAGIFSELALSDAKAVCMPGLAASLRSECSSGRRVTTAKARRQLLGAIGSVLGRAAGIRRPWGLLHRCRAAPAPRSLSAAPRHRVGNDDGRYGCGWRSWDRKPVES